MKSLLFLLGCFVLSLAAPQDQEATILSQESNVEHDGNYQYSYKTSNGIEMSETGQPKQTSDPENPIAVVAQGSFSYTGDDGVPIQVIYTADENGFVPQGAHLPTPPPIPAAIQKALDYIASHPPSQQ